jgi:hypothetical protein
MCSMCTIGFRRFSLSYLEAVATFRRDIHSEDGDCNVRQTAENRIYNTETLKFILVGHFRETDRPPRPRHTKIRFPLPL